MLWDFQPQTDFSFYFNEDMEAQKYMLSPKVTNLAALVK